MNTPMSAGMEAHMRQLVSRILDETQTAFDSALYTGGLPAARSVTFRITTPTDGTRAFALEVALLEVDPNTRPTRGFDRRGG